MGPANLSTVRGCPFFKGEKCISTIGKSTFGVLERVLCREVISMVSFSRGSTVYQIYTCMHAHMYLYICTPIPGQDEAGVVKTGSSQHGTSNYNSAANIINILMKGLHEGGTKEHEYCHISTCSTPSPL